MSYRFDSSKFMTKTFESILKQLLIVSKNVVCISKIIQRNRMHDHKLLYIYDIFGCDDNNSIY